VGIETLSADHTGSNQLVGIAFFNALDCWIKGVRDVNSTRAHVQAQYSARITVRDSYFFLTQNNISQSYGFEGFTGSDELIENNIFQGVSGPLTINGACSGTVLSYNFDVNNYYIGSPGYVNAMSNVHTAGTYHILYEGNVEPRYTGTSSMARTTSSPPFATTLVVTSRAAGRAGLLWPLPFLGPATTIKSLLFCHRISGFLISSEMFWARLESTPSMNITRAVPYAPPGRRYTPSAWGTAI
jgi:hypothetical protein